MTKKLKLDTMYNQDVKSLIKKIPDDSIDLIVTSPPYNIGKSYEKRESLSKYIELQSEIIRDCHRILKPTGSIFWQVGMYTNKFEHIPLDILLFSVFKDLGMFLKNRIIWPRAHGLQAKKRFSDRHESILWFTKSPDDYKFSIDPVRVPQLYPNKKYYKGDKKGQLSCNPLGKNPSDVWLFENIKHNHEEQTIHPAQFPESLIKRIILSTTEKKDTVFDPYGGVGTTAVVAKQLNRHFISTEKNIDYYKRAIQRLNGKHKKGQFVNLKQLREYYENNPDMDIHNFEFEVQTAKMPSLNGKTDLNKTFYSKEMLWDAISIILNSGMKIKKFQ